MRRAICILLTALLLAGIGCAAFAEAPEVLFGTVDGQSYRNEFFGIQFEAGGEWVFHDAIETAENIPYAPETIASREDLLRQFSNYGIVYDFQAVKSDGSGELISVDVVLMDLKAMFGTELETDALLDILESQNAGSSTDSGLVSYISARENISLAGADMPSIRYDAVYSGLSSYSRSVLVKQGPYLAMVQAASNTKENVDEALARFTPAGTAALNEKTAAALDEARLLINQGKGLEAMKLLLTTSNTAPDPALDTAIRRLENSQWRKTRQTTYMDDGSLLLDNTYAYDEGGRCVETVSLSPEGEVRSSQVYKFGQDGLLCESVMYDAAGNEKSRSAITCDERGNMIRMEGSVIYTYSYNPYGDAVLIVRSYEDGEELGRTFYTYDEYGLYSSMTSLIDGNSSETAFDNEYQFGDDGKTVHVISRLSGTDFVKTEYELTFMPLI